VRRVDRFKQVFEAARPRQRERASKGVADF
jgi:hypothetical protein